MVNFEKPIEIYHGRHTSHLEYLGFDMNSKLHMVFKRLTSESDSVIYFYDEELNRVYWMKPSHGGHALVHEPDYVIRNKKQTMYKVVGQLPGKKPEGRVSSSLGETVDEMIDEGYINIRSWQYEE